MTTFKAFLRVLQKNNPTIIISTLMLLIFGGFNMRAENNSTNFVADRPDITIINHDEDAGLTHELIEYLGQQGNIIELSDDETRLKDALFYRNTNFIVYIPENYHDDFWASKHPQIKYRSSGDYQAALAEMILSRFLATAESYRASSANEANLIKQIRETLDHEIETTIISTLNTTELDHAASYFNFESYALLNSLIFIIAMIMLAFNNPRVRQRLLVSSTNPTKQNRQLFGANLLFAFLIWLLYLILGIVLIGAETMFSLHGFWFTLNSFIFMICATAIAFLVSNLIHNKNALSGIVNVIALGSSFLCGAFVPQAWLPDNVLFIAHALPTFYFINANNLIAELETFDLASLAPILINLSIVIVFTIGFIIITSVLSHLRKKS